MKLKMLFRFSVKCIIVLLVALIAYLNVKLTHRPEFVIENGQSYNQDTYHQLQHLRAKINQGAANEMQDAYPEGFMFLHCMYALSWCDLVQALEKTSTVYQEGVKEIDLSLQAIQSDKSKQVFTKNQLLTYGAFYTGWSNYLLARKLALIAPEKRNLEEVELFKKECSRIANALSNSKSPYLSSYPSRAWPADMMPNMASLAIHDQIFSPRYQIDIKQWTDRVKNLLDPATGLIPHESNDLTGAVAEGARGSSQSLILCFLAEIDLEFGRQQFKRYSKLFIERKFGLPFIREYPMGQNGRGDIDSGPVIWHIGAAATIVAQRAMGIYGDLEKYQALRNSIEAVGFGYTTNNEKKYLFGSLPIADAFIAWSNSIEQSELVQPESIWHITFHLISLILVFLLLLFLNHISRRA